MADLTTYSTNNSDSFSVDLGSVPDSQGHHYNQQDQLFDFMSAKESGGTITYSDLIIGSCFIVLTMAPTII